VILYIRQHRIVKTMAVGSECTGHRSNESNFYFFLRARRNTKQHGRHGDQTAHYQFQQTVHKGFLLIGKRISKSRPHIAIDAAVAEATMR
jgi:hypothetical protein